MSRPERRRALLIGNAVYSDPRFSELACVLTDIEQVRRVLEDRRIGGFQYVRTAPNLTADEMRMVIAEFLGEAKSDELAVLYVSGHGTRLSQTTGEFQFIATDTDFDRIAETSVSAGFVNDQLLECRAPQKVVLLDCCLSGGFALGFQTQDTKSASATAAPLNSRGVYVLSSSGPGELSYGGGMTSTGPAMSVFTAEIVAALESGQADHDGDGKVGVDELFNHVNTRLRNREKETRQTPVKSAVGVDDLIVLADTGKPRMSAPTRIGESETSTKQVDGTADWTRLLTYYRNCVLAEGADTPLFPVNAQSGQYVCLTGSERLLSGDLDESGSIPVPPEAADLAAAAVKSNSELLCGYPAVVLTTNPDGMPARTPRFAPLLVRRVSVTEVDGELRLEPYGPVQPHRQLARERLSAEEAEELVATYQQTWHAGQHARLAADARGVLAVDFGLDCVQELDPQSLDPQIDILTGVSGARNVAVLFPAPAEKVTAQLVKDLDDLLKQPGQIKGTALEALLGTPVAQPARPFRLATPWQTNEAQRAVLQEAMTQRLTVTTGPPGTGKSQLVANLVATAVANGDKVLVGSTNNRAVDEVWERAEREVPGLLVRTGSGENRTREAEALQALTQLTRPTRTIATVMAECAQAVDGQEQVRLALADKGHLEQRLLVIGRSREQLSTELGLSTGDLTARLAPELRTWPSRARRVAAARLFGTWRRRRVLRRLGLDAEPSRSRCETVARYADADLEWNTARAAVAPSDGELEQRIGLSQHQVAGASRALVAETVRDAAFRGRAALRALVEQQGKGSDWGKVGALLEHVRGWAVTTLSARRFPPNPGLFDLVIIDEASQCSIASVLPMLFRARRALIIGDAMQLGHITKLKPAHEASIAADAGLRADFLEERRLNFCRDAAFHAAERAFGRPSLLLDEHYRCHPEIAEVSNRLFYGGALTVLTDVRALRRTDRAPLVWRHVGGHAARPYSGGSWVNAAEVEHVHRCVEYLLKSLPPDGTIGIVTPFAAQQERIAGHWAEREPDRVKVGTVHTFQGGERDAMIFSLVAAEGMNPGAVSWLENQANLWNVAITRAKGHLIVLGDDDHWLRRGGLGGHLRGAATSANLAPHEEPSRELLRLHRDASGIPGTEVELSKLLDGYVADALITSATGSTAVLLDAGHGHLDPAKHLRIQLLRTHRLRDPDNGTRALRLPAWRLYDEQRNPEANLTATP
ncbi:caspase, EACC1-associated type [Longispora urticae]